MNLTEVAIKYRPLTYLTIVLLVGACGTSLGGIVTQGDATHGRSLWAQSDCIGCHGVHAEGSRGGPALANTPLTNREVTNIVRRGGPGMPKYPASQMSDQDLQDVGAVGWRRGRTHDLDLRPRESPVGLEYAEG